MAYGLKACSCHPLTLKEPGLLDPSHSRESGFRRLPKISETDWQNIKCVVLVVAMTLPSPLVPKKVQTYLVAYDVTVTS